MALLFIPSADAQFRELGTITVNSGLLWTNPTNAVTNHIYIAETTNFLRYATVTTNRWPGDATKQLHGEFALYVTAVDAQGRESDPSEKVKVLFRAGVPVAPSQIQIYTVVQAAATNTANRIAPVPPTP